MDDDDVDEEDIEEPSEAELELINQWLEAERLHAIFSETADNRRPPPFTPKKRGWRLFRKKSGRRRGML